MADLIAHIRDLLSPFETPTPGQSTSSIPIYITMGGGPKIPYPKHVWSPSGGWYAQPVNWKANTAIAGLVIFGITACAWKLSAELEYRHKMPEPDRFFPSRYWSRQIIEYEKEQRELKAAKEKAGEKST
ncbi:hypothetical protein B0H67DRAFT_645503 [Lasiosphaeris hirsuta]|uniref:Uncharacterized protein n=1 Tax=Lasiosphaeris hirsuta TaxID=260670 RepID=A0AA40DU93_9PEZI|nr:hypothetical protein B0H67DRAFT_645503 [Lasiosphaeris hirsuta]